MRHSPMLITSSRRKIDQNVANEIKMSMETGILSNNNNEVSHRMSRSSQRQSAIARKSRRSRAAAELKVANGTSGKKKKKSNEPLPSASSSGRVKTSRGRAGNSILLILLIWLC
jgi:hypothetical protein